MGITFGFFFQAEDGIRDDLVTGVQTCALPISNYILSTSLPANNNQYTQMLYVPMYSGSAVLAVEYKKWMLRAAYTYTGYRYLSSDNYNYLTPYKIGRASCRERV